MSLDDAPSRVLPALPGGSLFEVTTGAVVADYVRRLIWDGTLRAGDRVRQGDIAAALGVSRVPVREGLVAVESEGLVFHEPQRGVFVADLDDAFVRDHYALLGLVLSYLIETAMQRSGAVFETELVALEARTARALAAEEMFPLGVEFKELVCRFGGSARARAAMGVMERLVPGNLHAQIDGSTEITRVGVGLVTRAVQAGDARAASAAMRTMSERLGDLVLANLIERGIIATGQ